MSDKFDLSKKLPETDVSAVLGRLSFVAAIAVLIWASFAQLPRLFGSYHAEHFAAFYALAFTGALANKKRRLITIGYLLIGCAVILETTRTFLLRGVHLTYLDWLADAAGVIAALAPMLCQKFRDRF